jgi:DNA (cytosine-5)-methyltransferase 1
MGAKTGLYIVGYTRDKNGKRTNHIKNEAGTIKSVTGSNSNQSDFILISDSGKKRKKEIKEVVPPLRANNGASGNNIIANHYEIRRLTPTECERLQGFPDGYTEGISDTQRYKCLGNAISVPPVEEIYRRLYGIKNNS